MQEIYKIENRVVYDPEKGLSPNALAAFFKAGETKEAKVLLAEMQTAYKTAFTEVNTFESRDFTGFIEYLVSHVEDNTPKGMTSLLELDELLKGKIKDYIRIRDILAKHPRSIYLQKQTKSPYGETTPLMLYAFKRAGYDYKHWSLEDKGLPLMLGPNLTPLIALSKGDDVLRRVIEGKRVIAEEKGTPWQWLAKKSYPNIATIRSIAKKYKMEIGDNNHVNPVIVSILLGCWCNFDNPNNIGIGIYSTSDWDFRPAETSALEILKSNPLGLNLDSPFLQGGEIW